ncbi:hypothetical protein AQJ54_41110 [Streptomyces griseorubiginosus]|uniref:Uncharacterized protein n=1 Tax=Streptomyces griseorubiginosus TaxID=67304 RepID=A0A101RN94_9ACTN|nr:hypothetical protein AQJ54_41110 [Streptomyces griseorubiginosus]
MAVGPEQLQEAVDTVGHHRQGGAAMQNGHQQPRVALEAAGDRGEFCTRSALRDIVIDCRPEVRVLVYGTRTIFPLV